MKRQHVMKLIVTLFVVLGGSVPVFGRGNEPVSVFHAKGFRKFSGPSKYVQVNVEDFEIWEITREHGNVVALKYAFAIPSTVRNVVSASNELLMRIVNIRSVDNPENLSGLYSEHMFRGDVAQLIHDRVEPKNFSESLPAMNFDRSQGTRQFPVLRLFSTLETVNPEASSQIEVSGDEILGIRNIAIPYRVVNGSQITFDMAIGDIDLEQNQIVLRSGPYAKLYPLFPGYTPSF